MNTYTEEEVRLIIAGAVAEEREAAASVVENTTAFVQFQSEDCYRFAQKAADAIRKRASND